MNAHPKDATVVITTKDRKEELRTAVRSAIDQTADPEVLVLDDGSSDGTAEMIQKEFPEVRLHRKEECAGLIVRRNQAARLAKEDIIFSIDDDAEFSTKHVVEQTLADFDHERVGAVAIPYADVNKSPKTRHRAPDSDAIYCTATFKGTAHALRRSLFLDLGGYREHFFHQGEESDYCVRMLDAGYVVRLGRADRIDHYESPNRDFTRMDYYGRRNEVLFAWHNAPGILLPKYLLAAAVNTVRTAYRYRRVRHFVRGLLAGYRDCVRFRDRRAPVRTETIQLFRRLRGVGGLRLRSVLQQIEEG